MVVTPTGIYNPKYFLIVGKYYACWALRCPSRSVVEVNAYPISGDCPLTDVGGSGVIWLLAGAECRSCETTTMED